jgi:polyphosphate kinase
MTQTVPVDAASSPTAVIDADEAGVDSRSRFFNRELSALDYHERVLACAADANRPALQRAQFLAIFSGNLDEFFQIRVSGLREQATAGVSGTSPDGMSPGDQIKATRARAQELVSRADRDLPTRGEAEAPRRRHHASRTGAL